MKIFVIIPLLMLILVMGTPFSNAQGIPDWVKNTAGWWASDAISETEFVNAVEFLINEGVIQVMSTPSSTNSESVPDWVKNTAGWWASDAISETEFVNAISFLVNVGIISIEEEKKCVNDLLEYFDDKEKIINICDEHELMIHDELIPYETKLKINSLGLRGEEFSEKKQVDVYRIFMVGGSTMLSAEVSDDSTIPSILQKMFDSAELNMNVEVINAGISGSNTKTELELIKSKLINYEPDLIIMYDGWNDLSADNSIKKTIKNYELICQEAINNDFELIITIQPIAGFGEKQLTFQEKINSITGQDHNGFQLIHAASTYDYLVRQVMILDEYVEKNSNGVCSTHDLRNVFDIVSGPIYWDQGHVSHAGNLILAERFFEIIIEKIDLIVIPDSKFTNIVSNYNSIPVIEFLLNQLEIDEKLLEKKVQDVSKISTGKGKYFQLKDEFTDVSNIFVGKDLRNVNLDKINLEGYDLTGANLSGHDLRKIDFTDAIIRNTDLSDANLQGKNLSGMDLRGINFSNANLKDVDFTDAIFSKTIQISGDCQDEDEILNVWKNFTCMTEVIKMNPLELILS